MSVVSYALQIQEGRACGYIRVFPDFLKLKLEARTLPVLVGRARTTVLAELERRQQEGAD